MRASGNRLLTAFLCFSVVFFAVAMLVQEDELVDPADPEVDARSHDASGVRPAKKSTAVDSDEAAGAGAGIDIDANASTVVAMVSASGPNTANRNHPSLGSYDFEEPTRQLKLPKRLREISGLAMLGENRLLAHDDERGVVSEIDYLDGSIVKRFELGGPRGRVADDLEGIAAAGSMLYLVSSTGRLYEFSEGADGATVPYKRYETGVGRLHEIEGLAYDPDQRVLLLVSKNPRNPRQEDQIAIYRWSPDTRQLVEEERILIEASALARRIDRTKFQPSGIERHPVSGNYFVVAARQHAVAEITPRGKVLAVNTLKAGRHRQAEGISFAADHTMVIADEGSGKRATLSFYPIARGR